MRGSHYDRKPLIPGMTRKELAEIFGVGVATIAVWERDNSRIPKWHMERYLELKKATEEKKNAEIKEAVKKALTRQRRRLTKAVKEGK